MDYEYLEHNITEAKKVYGEDITHEHYLEWTKNNQRIADFYEHFDCWSEFKKYFHNNVGVRIKRNSDEYNKDSIARILIKANEDISGTMTSSKYQEWAIKNKKVSLGIIYNHFNSWNNAKMYAGIETVQSGVKFRYTKEQVINVWKEAFSEINAEDFNLGNYNQWAKNKNYPQHIVAVRCFKSWRNAKYEIVNHIVDEYLKDSQKELARINEFLPNLSILSKSELKELREFTRKLNRVSNALLIEK